MVNIISFIKDYLIDQEDGIRQVIIVTFQYNATFIYLMQSLSQN